MRLLEPVLDCQKLVLRLVALFVKFLYPGYLVYYLPSLDGIHLHYLGNVALKNYIVPVRMNPHRPEYLLNLLPCDCQAV